MCLYTTTSFPLEKKVTYSKSYSRSDNNGRSEESDAGRGQPVSSLSAFKTISFLYEQVEFFYI